MSERIASRHVLIDYTNHAGMRQQRTIVPDMGGIFFGSSQWHAEEQWLLNAFDVGKEAVRTFAVADIHGWHPAAGRSARVERSLAKALQASMELNARLKARLERLKRVCADDPHWEDLTVPIGFILRDEEPAWPAV